MSDSVLDFILRLNRIQDIDTLKLNPMIKFVRKLFGENLLQYIGNLDQRELSPEGYFKVVLSRVLKIKNISMDTENSDLKPFIDDYKGKNTKEPEKNLKNGFNHFEFQGYGFI